MWSGHPTSISSLLKVISLDSYKRALSSVTSADKHSIPALEAMLTKAFVAIFHSFVINPTWSNKILNLELFCKVVIVAAGRAGFSSLSPSGSAQITTAATPFPLWFRSEFLLNFLLR